MGMEDYPLTIIEFEKWFTSEEACREYIFQLRWPDGFRCSRCANEKAWLTKRKLYHCTQFVLKLTIQGLQALWTERQLTQLSTSLIPTIQEGIEPGSLVRTDDWNGDIGLSSKGYNHIVMRQSANVGENLLPLAHRVAALLKKWLQGTHQGAVRGFHLDFYLDEFTFRFNRRTSRSRGKLFFRLIQQAVNIEPVKGRDIRGDRLHK